MFKLLSTATALDKWKDIDKGVSVMDLIFEVERKI